MGEQEITYYRRYHGYDYSRGASLFITMVTDPRKALFGRVVNAKVERSLLGEKVFESLEAIPSFNPGLRLFEHELMPDHLHCNIYLPPITRDGAGFTPGGAGESGQFTPGGAGESGQFTPGGAGESGQFTPGGAGDSGQFTPGGAGESGQFTPGRAGDSGQGGAALPGQVVNPDPRAHYPDSRAPARVTLAPARVTLAPARVTLAPARVDEANRAQLQRLGAAMRRFKTYTTTLARKMAGLAKLWQQGYHDRICTSRRFIEAIARYIRYNALKYELMYNQPAFMKIREPLDSPRLDTDDFWKGLGNVSLLNEANKLLSLRVSRKTRDIKRLVSRMEDAVRAGYTIMSGFISPGEVAVRNMLLENRNARFIHVMPSCMKNGHRPDSRYLRPLQEGRFLEIGEGNDESEFGRSACLALNDEIVKIACAGEGLGVYWKDERAWRMTPSTLAARVAAPDGRDPGVAGLARRWP